MPAKDIISGFQNSRQYTATLFWRVIAMTFGSFTYGYTMSIIATTLGQPTFITYMGLDTNPHAAAITGAAVALFFGGGFFGAASTWFIADRFGRRAAIATGSAIVLVAGALVAGSVNIAMFIVFRFICGFGALMLTIAVPLWISEIAPPNSRGFLAGLHAFMTVLGFTVSAYVGIGFYYYKTTNSAQWRGPLALVCLWPLINLATIPFVNESPRWLMTRDRFEEASKILETLHARDDDPGHEYARAEFLQIQRQNELDKTMNTSWIEIWRRPSYRKRFMIAGAMTFFCNTCGTLVVSNYGSTIYSELGYSASQSLEFIAGTGPVAAFGMLVSFPFVDRVPRNRLIAAGILGCAICLSCEAAMTASFLGTTNKSGLSAAVAFIYLVVFCYNVFLEGPSWYLSAEIMPTHLRAKGMTFGLLVFCCSNLLWLNLSPTAFKNIGWRFYLVFICISLASSITVFFFFPNTLGKPLEEVARLFGDEDLVAVYQADLTVDHERDSLEGEKVGGGSHVEVERVP